MNRDIHAIKLSQLWREVAENVRGQALPCGHYLPEEAPEETLAALLEFL